MGRSIQWYLRRHPLLYKIRFRLVSKNTTLSSVEHYCYNDINKKNNVSSIFYELNTKIFANYSETLTNFEKAKKITLWLKNNIKGGPGLGKSSTTALKKMIQGEGGVCSDVAQVFNNFCVINDLKVKEWGMKNSSKDSSISGGHSFNEVYCNEFQKWIMIDVGKSIVFKVANQNIPLSAFEFIKFKKENKEINVIDLFSNSKIEDDNINNVFLKSNSSLFVITNYNNKNYDYLLDKLEFLPESIIHGLLFIVGKSYVFEFPNQ
ncbi:transglutaminase domain-containing protein [Flavobacterium sp.]|uniref:transglutaminase domain-containing protein n=1 Tax=Flavobacterium sp. TaxID=239 RepID=UPI00286B6840|nr:transglutaminase domain-containing protein [Flavobacterium sp.]